MAEFSESKFMVLFEEIGSQLRSISAHNVDTWGKVIEHHREHGALHDDILAVNALILKTNERLVNIASRLSEIAIIMNHYWDNEEKSNPVKKPIEPSL